MSNDRLQLVLQLFVRHQPRIKGVIEALLGNFAGSEDVLQETFLVIREKAEEFSPESNFLAWAFQIARFQVLKHRQQKRRMSSRFSDAVLDALAASAPCQEIEESHLLALSTCVEKLAPQARRIMDLFYKQEHSPQEIARMMDWTPAAVSVALSRARRFLRECVEHQLRVELP